ncbi:hypothetical protein HQ346_10155 [Rhodococcus sp. BP-252]|uniref:DUF5926 family protein n=1 Tax=unclassified Rhodococcus (in: high G+C Gram-positive bacteria) TaxID=192944 RepID=UPI001C9A4FB4|nr:MULTISPECIES: DUF5926 family protein [unclassified Rhodococcus (in: high G+C Gram-positive bacteria)]MBY6411790.1 hypothetical protein [Rhodococcus sp. BP-320]MBY6416582.1 hypothetical protein [Rhodococcus sp. BP-321]MBY6420612.1 hypothetical protein [Rhodococcus sp. BP-324]MBY6426606.1 hypothetical protein [Rhodococcus sp. BP-323]MBY6431605.1 hypothetical protein [Rhodococcus sp. BP-322]
MGKSKRNSGPKQGTNRAALLAQREADRRNAAAAPVRPFQGVAAECDLVALREFVPSATAPVEVDGRTVTIATVLPGAVAALTRDEDGATKGYAALQVQAHSPNVAADLSSALRWAAGAEAGESLEAANPDGNTAPIGEVLGSVGELDITVHQDFNWWIPESASPAPDVAATVERANQAIMPSARLEGEGLVAAWWVDAGDKAHLRWVRPESEDDLMLALARLHAAGDLSLGEGSRYAGSFRTHGLLVPVFDLDPEMHPTEWATPTIEFGAKLSEALADDAPLTSEQRRSRDGLRSRQVTLR